MATFPSFAAGQRLTAATLTDLRDLTRYVEKQADESVTSSITVQDDDDLFISVDANAIYLFELIAFGTSAADNAGDIKFSFTFPAGAVINGSSKGPNQAALLSGSSSDGEWVGRLSSSTWPFGLSLSTISMEVRGRLDMGGTAGTFRLQWAQNSSNANASTLKAGSFLKVQRIA